MRNQAYCTASILLYDIRPHVRQQTRASLIRLGFRDIADVGSVTDLTGLVDVAGFDLLILATAALDDGVAELLMALRRHRRGVDPFAPVILTSWQGSSRFVKSMLGCGTDHYLIWPYAPAQLGLRIDALVRCRKPFVETRDYLGPDRRGGGGRRSGAGSVVEVPNALRAAVEGRPDLAPSPAAIKAARTGLERIRIGNLARRVGAIAKIIKQRIDERDYRLRAAADMDDLLATLAVMRAAAEATDLRHLLSFCQAVEDVAGKLRETAPVWDPKGLALLEQAALALRVAVEMDDDSARAALKLAGQLVH